MRRLLAAAVFGVGTFGAIGCAGNATFVKKFPDGGEIALKAGGDQAEVRKMIEKHVGPDFEMETYQPSLQQQTAFDPSKGMTAAKVDPGEMRYVYKKKVRTDVTGLPAAPGTGLPGAPAGGVGQAGFQQPNAGIPLGTSGVPAGTSGFGTMGGGMQPPDLFPRSK